MGNGNAHDTERERMAEEQGAPSEGSVAREFIEKLKELLRRSEQSGDDEQLKDAMHSVREERLVIEEKLRRRATL